MYQFHVRPAKISDAGAISNICRKELDVDFPLNEAENMLKDISLNVNESVFIATHSTHTVGYIYARLVKNLFGDITTEVINIAALKYYRRNGVLYALLETVEKWSAQMFSRKIKCNFSSEFFGDELLLKNKGYQEKTLVCHEKDLI